MVATCDATPGADDAVSETEGADDAGGATSGVADFWGAMHCVQIVDVVVLMMVEMVLVTCRVGVPWGGVTVLVTGQVVKVVYTLHFRLVEAHVLIGSNAYISVVTNA